MVKVGSTYSIRGYNKKDATKRAYEIYGFSRRVKFQLVELMPEPPFKIYKLTVTEIK